MFWIIMTSILFCLLVFISCQIIVLSASWKRMYSDVNKIPHKEVGLLLGTSPTGRTGRPNQFFYRRIDAAIDLYSTGKIDRIIISGAKPDRWYDEPEAMRKELIKRGVPNSILILDGKGFHTIDSIVRAKKVFGVNSLIIISQRFHNERALFMAKYNGIDAIAYNAANTSSRKWKLIMMGRECGSRVKAVYEIIRNKVCTSVKLRNND